MRRPILVVVLILLASCARKGAAPSDAVRREASAPAGVVDAVSSDVPANCLPGCDVSTPLGIIDAYARITGRSSDRSSACTRDIPELGGIALVGSLAADQGCVWTEVIRDCCIEDAAEASAGVLGAIGWAAAGPSERSRLALLWVRRAIYATDGVLLEEPEGFAESGRRFHPPDATATSLGGVIVRIWKVREGRMLPGVEYDRVEIVFSPAGAVTSKATLESFEVEALPNPAANP